MRANEVRTLAGNTVSLRWNVRQVMAARGMFKSSDLTEPLATRGVEISRQMIHKLVTGTPQRINVDVLAALCDVLQCTPNDLLELRVEPRVPARPTGADRAGIGELRPVRATVRRPEGM